MNDWSWNEQYKQGVRMGEFACPNTTVLVWRPRSIVLDTPQPQSTDPGMKPPADIDIWLFMAGMIFACLGWAILVGYGITELVAWLWRVL